MYDVIVIGGGPAGSTAAALLARKQLRVLVLEKEKFPRFQIGESLLPYNNDVFERLGLTETLQSASFIPKYGATFVTADGQLGHAFKFGRSLPERYASALQVRRDEFDEMLLRNAQKAGAEVREQTAARTIDVADPRKAVVVATASDGTEQTLEARFVIDASGHASLIGQRLGTRVESKELRKISLFGHYKGVVPRAKGRAAGDTVIAVLRNGWFWMIPVGKDQMSVGLVAERDNFVASGLSAEEFLDRSIQAAPYVAECLRNATRIGPIRARKDFSYQVGKLSSTNYALAGDAAGFIDPIFSTGVYMAMKSSEIVADAVEEYLATGQTARFVAYEKRFRRAYQKYLRFVSSFYKREFIEVFLQPNKRLGIFASVVEVLAGSVFESRRSQLRLSAFFMLVRLQKMFGVIAPRVAWDKLGETARA